MDGKGEPVLKNHKPFYIKGFDGLRAISIILVILTHLGAYDWMFGKTLTNRLWHTVSGEVGVTVFFAISGFLITTLLLREKKSRGTISYRSFIIRRFLRLLPPLIFFYITMFYLILAGYFDYSFYALLISIFYLYNFVPNSLYYSELGHTWSLGVEEQFYLFWPWVITFFTKNKILITAALIITISAVVITFLPFLPVTYHSKKYILGNATNVGRWFLPAASPIMIGCAVAVFNFFNADLTKIIINYRITKLIAVAFILSAFLIPLSLIKYLFIFQPCGFAIILCYIFNQQNSTLTNLLEWKPLAFIGKISYGIYVWQGLFLRTGPGGTLWIQQVPQNILLTFIVALISYYLIEKKVLKLKERFKK